uniref:Uncharacterized protein n=1 Tax=Pararge aegeria TaxID=116150 RepID=S4PKW2_9NEOP
MRALTRLYGGLRVGGARGASPWPSSSSKLLKSSFLDTIETGMDMLFKNMSYESETSQELSTDNSDEFEFLSKSSFILYSLMFNYTFHFLTTFSQSI